MKILLVLTSFVLSVSSFSQGFENVGKKKYNNIYATIIGISDYSEVQDLKFANADAQLFYDILNLSFPESKKNFTLLTNEQAGERSIKQSIYNSQKNVAEGDLVIIYFSGHGDVMLEPGLEEGFFLSHDASKSREYFIGGAVEFDWVNKMTNMITAKKGEVWLITDACHAGSVINQDDVKATMTSLNTNFENTTKFISCQAHELSYEYAALQHGAFTYYLAKSLLGEANTDGDATLNIDEISSYLKREVRKYTGDKQSPRVSSSNEFEPFFNVTPEIASLIEGINADGSGDLASRGKGEGDKEKSASLVKFEQTIYAGKLYGSSDAAKEMLASLKSTVSETEYRLMQNMLIDALLARGQRNTNLFLSGRPMIAANESMASTAADLKLAAKLLGQDHFMAESLLDKSKFFDAMDVLQSDDFKELKVAETTLLSLSEKYPNAAYINQGLGMLYIKTSQKQKATDQLNVASKKVSTWDKPLNSNAYLNIIGGQLKEAKKLIDESESLTKDGDNANLLKALMFTAGYELQSAEAALRQIKNEENTFSQSELLKIEGEINELRGRVKVAQANYTQSLAEDDNNVSLLMKLADLYKSQRDTTTALKFYKRVVRLDKNNQAALANIASLKKSTVSINNSLIDASNVTAVLSAVEVLEGEKDFQKAIDLLERSVTVVQWNPDLYYELGKMQYSAGLKTESMKSIQKAIEISPYHFKSIRSLAYMYLHEKKKIEASALIKKHDPYFQKSAKYLALSYQVYRQIDSKRDLYPILERAIELDSLESDAYRALYQLHIENSLYNEAQREYKNLDVIGAGSIQDSLDFYNRLERQITKMLSLHIYEGQKEGLKILLDADPYNFEMAYFMGLILYMEGDYDAANKQLRIFSKSIQSFSPGVQKTYYNLKAKINLETDHPELAFRLFDMSSSNDGTPDYLGLAMAQYELGKEWQTNFRRAKEPLDYNEDAIKRYNKMSKKAGGSGYSGGTERKRR